MKTKTNFLEDLMITICEATQKQLKEAFTLRHAVLRTRDFQERVFGIADADSFPNFSFCTGLSKIFLYL